MEACPQFNESTGFVGAATISQVRLFNTHPTGAALKRERLAALMGDGGIQECGYAQNCVEVCPKDIPLTRSISQVGGEVMKQASGRYIPQVAQSRLQAMMGAGLHEKPGCQQLHLRVIFLQVMALGTHE